MQYKNIIVDKNESIPYFPPHCGIQCSIPSKVCPLRKRLPLSCHKNSSQIFDATKLWKHTIPPTYNTKTLISNKSETHRFSPQMRLIAYPDHKTTHNTVLLWLLQVGVAHSCEVMLLLLQPLDAVAAEYPQHTLQLLQPVVPLVDGQFYKISQNWESSCAKTIASWLHWLNEWEKKNIFFFFPQNLLSPFSKVLGQFCDIQP